jgi:MOB kinase activator 1
MTELNELNEVQTLLLRGRDDDSEVPLHTGVFRLHQDAEATLGNDKFLVGVKLPYRTLRNEWIASKMVSMYTELGYVISALDVFCTAESCPVMSAGRHWAYAWADETNPNPVSMPAMQYMFTLLQYTHNTLSNRRIVPLDGSPYPDDWLPRMRLLMKRIFRVYAHAYIHHFEKFQEHESEAHLNHLFKHFLFFAREFQLVDEKDMEPLKDLIAKFVRQWEEKAVPLPAGYVEFDALYDRMDREAAERAVAEATQAGACEGSTAGPCSAAGSFSVAGPCAAAGSCAAAEVSRAV